MWRERGKNAIFWPPTVLAPTTLRALIFSLLGSISGPPCVFSVFSVFLGCFMVVPCVFSVFSMFLGCFLVVSWVCFLGVFLACSRVLLSVLCRCVGTDRN